jgi:phosphoribosylformylglycinamidine synthase
VVRPGAAAAGVVRVPVPGTDRAKAIAVTAGCPQRMVYLAPYEGSRLAVADAYASLVAVGATPLAVTDCLNFGSPERPDIMWQFAESVRGLADACRALDTPVVSGNVSFYNETEGQAIRPTPMIGMVGLLADAACHATSAFRDGGDHIALVVAAGGRLSGALDGSEYLERLHGRVEGVPAPFDAARHRPVMEAVRRLVESRLVGSACAVADGGLLVALAECAISGARAFGIDVRLPCGAGERIDELAFGEAPARFVISYGAVSAREVEALVRGHGAALVSIGRVGGDRFRVTLETGGRKAAGLDLALDALEQAWRDGLGVAIG